MMYLFLYFFLLDESVSSLSYVCNSLYAQKSFLLLAPCQAWYNPCPAQHATERTQGSTQYHVCIKLCSLNCQSNLALKVKKKKNKTVLFQDGTAKISRHHSHEWQMIRSWDSEQGLGAVLCPDRIRHYKKQTRAQAHGVQIYGSQDCSREKEGRNVDPGNVANENRPFKIWK